MPVVYVVLILVLVTRRVAEIPIPESKVGKSGAGLRHLCSTALRPEDGARHGPAQCVQEQLARGTTAMGKIISVKSAVFG